MKINTKILIKASLALIAAGAVLMMIGHLLGGRAGVAFSRNGVVSPYTDQKPYTMKKTKIDAFTDTEIKIGSYADVRILPSGDDDFYLEYRLDGDYGEPLWEVRDDTLTLTHTGRQPGFGVAVNFFYIGIREGLQNAEVNLYIPEGEKMGRLEVYNDSGDFSVEDLTFGDAKLNISYGDARLRDVSLRNLELGMESGVLKADAFTCDTLTAKVDYGNAELDGFSAETAEFTLESGNLDLDARELTDLTCINEYGNVKIRLPKDLSEYSVNARSEYGSIDIPEGAPGRQVYTDDEGVYTSEGKSEGNIRIKVESGDIVIK